MEVGRYQPPYFLFNKHLETIYPAVFRKVNLPPFRRERIITPDNDFLDLDWLEHRPPSLHASALRLREAATAKQGAGNPQIKLVIISHGLEGNSQRPYIKGMAKAFFDQNYDVLAWNYRGCGDEMNKQLRFYHSGASDDLDIVVKHAATKYQSVFLVGFSLGGNITLKYLGEKGDHAGPVKGAAVFSVPLNLHSSCERISKPGNFVYSYRFLKSLKKKVITKSIIRGDIDIHRIGDIGNLKDFDDRYTAPLHGFKDALDYYKSCSSLYFLKDIRVPALIVNAKNDPFLADDCYPTNIDNPHLHFEFPERGGHVGFAMFSQNGLYWSELRALRFAEFLDVG
jgi:predicted alpha/beta-fold hydrolase